MVEQLPDTAQRSLGRRLSLVVVALTMIAPFSIDTYLPSMPDIAREFGVSSFYLQQTLSLYLIAFAGMTLVYGPLSDAFGRRNVVLGRRHIQIGFSAGVSKKLFDGQAIGAHDQGAEAAVGFLDDGLQSFFEHAR